MHMPIATRAHPIPVPVPVCWQAFRTNLVTLTDVTKNYFVKFVKQLEKGFENMETEFAGECCGTLVASCDTAFERTTTVRHSASIVRCASAPQTLQLMCVPDVT